MATVSILLFLTLNSITTSALNFSIHPPFNTNSKNLILTGDANSHPTSIHLAKQNNGKSGIGRVYYSSKIQFMNVENRSQAASFDTHFTFKILQLPSFYKVGDGLAFILVPSDGQPPVNSDGMYLGLLNRNTSGSADNHLFAVEFDTLVNEEMDARYEPRDQHIGIDINGVESRKTVLFNLSGNVTFHAWIEYNGVNRNLEVRVSSTPARPDRALLNYTIDLAEIVKEQMYVGFSASTAKGNAMHRLFSWNFSSYGIKEQPYPPMHCKGLHCRKSAIVFGCTGAILLLGILLVYPFIRCSRVRLEHTPLIHFQYSKLSHATKGFSRSHLLGRGGYGKVYKADFRGDTLAVKILKEVSSESQNQFLSELLVLGEFRHPNLVSLRGWCHSKGKPILVYEYMPNSSLDKHIFGTAMSESLSWSRRYEILKGVAQAILYLHEGREERILHRDIKAANVLLDKDFAAKLGDFGLARLLDQRQGLQTMTKAGTAGYIAPELSYAGKATEKSDVYSYGILCLEIVTGRRTLDPVLEVDDMILLDWVWAMHESGKLVECVDERLVQFDKVQVQRVLYMAFACCDMDCSARPKMRECVNILEEKISPPSPPDTRPPSGFLQGRCT